MGGGGRGRGARTHIPREPNAHSTHDNFVFAPPRLHVWTIQNAWEILRKLVVGYIDEDDLDDPREPNEHEGEIDLREDVGHAGHEPFWKDRKGYIPMRRPRTVAGRNLSINHESMVRCVQTM